MAFDKGKYDMNYAKAHITRKHIPFNDTVPEDVETLAWLNSQGNVTQYVKRLIREDMGRRANTPDYIRFPEIDGFRDEAAIDDCTAKNHTIRVIHSGNWEVRIDIDARRVLTVNALHSFML